MHPVFEKRHPTIQRALAKHNFTEPTASWIVRKLRVSEDRVLRRYLRSGADLCADAAVLELRGSGAGTISWRFCGG
jgi:hypothetical protein